MRVLPRAGLSSYIPVTLHRVLRRRCVASSATRLFIPSPPLRTLYPVSWDHLYDATSSELTNESLLSLVQSRQFEAAHIYRLQLIDNDIPIETHPLYEDAAIAVWRKGADLNAFATWLRLIPEKANERPNTNPFVKSRHELLRSGEPAEVIPAVTRLAIICASKGYGDLVWHEVVLLLSRFATQDQASLFLLKFEVAVKRYAKKTSLHLEQAIFTAQRKRTLDVCCHAGWLDAALQIVQHSRGMPISSQCQLLLQKLQERNDQANVLILGNLMHEEGWISPPVLPSNGTLRFVDSSSKPVFNSRTPSAPQNGHIIITRGEVKLPGTDRRTIATRLKRTKDLIQHRQPPTDSLQHLRTVYETTASIQGRSLSILRKRALSNSDSCAERWLCDELRYLTFKKKFSELFATFDANFHSAFILPMAYNAIKETITHTPSSNSTQNLDTVPIKLTIKTTDAYLIWNALIQLSITLPSPSSLSVLEQLYFSLLGYSRRLTVQEFRGSHPAYPAAFRSCIYAFGMLGQPRLAASVVEDMATPAIMGGSRKGPDRRHQEMLGYVYARAGMKEEAMTILSAVEQDNHPTRGSPKISTYGMIMEGFLEAGRVEAAVVVRDRMKKRIDYVPNKNDRFEEVLRALEAAQGAKIMAGI